MLIYGNEIEKKKKKSPTITDLFDKAEQGDADAQYNFRLLL
jgi:hypothetical protein